MTSHDLLDLIGDAREEYVLEAQEYRELPSESRRIPLRKTFLIAAIIALTLLLVGCTVVYVLSLQEMKVGEHSFTEPAYINDEGETVPAEEKTTALVSLQGIYQPALEEWLEFKEHYDPDKALLIANDHNESGVPEPYYTTYACYTWEMVDKLDEIIEKYDLKLLEPYIIVQSWEKEILFDALKINNIHLETANAQVEYGSGYFYPEGTFQINAYITLTGSDWAYQNLITLRYSLKEYFDPVSGSVGDIDSYDQWNYTTKHGLTVLLAMNETDAHIYANLEDAFISIQMNAYGGSGKVPMPKEALQQIADVIDFTVKPEYADLKLVERMMAEAAAEKEAQSAAEKVDEEAMIASGYESYLQYRLESDAEVYYSLYDLNSDGARELILRDAQGYCYEVLSETTDGSFLYFTPAKTCPISVLTPCDGNVFELSSSLGNYERYYYFRAGADGAEYIEGLTYHKEDKIWYYHPDDDPWTDNDETIHAAEALEILNSYIRDPLGEAKRAEDFPFGEARTPGDPYARHIADCLGSKNADSLRYTLRDLNGDGVEELLIQSPCTVHGEPGTALSIYSQDNGELVDLNIVFIQNLCEGNLLEDSSRIHYVDEYHNYYQLKTNSVQLYDKVYRDPETGNWFRDRDGSWGEEPELISAEEAQQIIGSYKPMELDWKPLSEYS